MLKEKIESDFKKALKEGKKAELSALRMLKSEIINKQKEKRYKTSKNEPDMTPQQLEEESLLTDEEIMEVALSMIKRAKQSITEFEKGGRQDLAAKEKKEIEVFRGYLPKQLSKEELKKMAAEAIREAKAESIKDMGKVMSNLVPKIKGRAEGKEVAAVVKGLLS